MSSVILTGDTSGTITLSAPLVAGSNTVTLPAQTGTLEMLGVSTVQNSTSGTSITFTGIPSWAKRVTVMFNGVSTNGTSAKLVQIGTSGGIQSTGYNSVSNYLAAASTGGTSSTAGFIIYSTGASETIGGSMVLTLEDSATGIWTCTFNGFLSTTAMAVTGGYKSLSGTLDRVSITTANGTDTFDAGTINIMYEG